MQLVQYNFFTNFGDELIIVRNLYFHIQYYKDPL